MALFPFISSWLPVGLWAGLIYYLSSIPHLGTGWGIWDLILRKMAHVFEFAMLTALLIRAFRRTQAFRTRASILGWSSAISVLYAMSDEFHQSFTPGRGPSVRDVLIDGCGVFLSVWVLRNRCLERRSEAS